MARNFMLSGFIRIDSTNNVISIVNDAAPGPNGTLNVSITQGVYTLGFGASNPASSTDSAAYGFTSLLQQVEADFTALGITDWEFGLQTEFNGASGIGASTSGHVFVKAAASDALNFSSSSFTFPKHVFGAARSGSAFVDHTFAGTTFEDVSDHSSSLAVVGDRTIGSETDDRAIREVATVADNGKSYWNSIGGTPQRLRELRIHVAGLPRDSQDSGYHTVRRFFETLRTSRSGRRFYYFPDISLLNWGDYDPDNVLASRRWGQQDVQLDARTPARIVPARRYERSNFNWTQIVPVRDYVA